MRSVLVLGSGGREHAMVWHLKQYGYKVFSAPGSDRLIQEGNQFNFKNFDELSEKVTQLKIDDIIVGPEKYLAEGVSNFFNKKKVSIFGPTREAAQLETDKAWAKEFCKEFLIPTARSITAHTLTEVETALQKFSKIFVLKASGLAQGKGVWIGESKAEALKFAEQNLKSHPSIVLEEFLEGEELSFFALVDGPHFSILGSAQDHKRLLENDEGPNTGGMGAYSPVPLLTKELETKIISKILEPTVLGLQKKNIHYRGFIFLGIMAVQGEPYLLEYNCRLGDPETQALLPRLKTSLLEQISNIHRRQSADLDERVALNVVIAAKGYPEHPQSGFVLEGIDRHPGNIHIFHSGTQRRENQWMASGGRLFSVAALAPSLLECQNLVYPWIESLDFQEKIIFRRDIGVKAYRHLRGLSHA